MKDAHTQLKRTGKPGFASSMELAINCLLQLNDKVKRGYLKSKTSPRTRAIFTINNCMFCWVLLCIQQNFTSQPMGVPGFLNFNSVYTPWSPL